MGNFRLANAPIIRAALAILAGLAMVVIAGCGNASPTQAEQHLIDQADAICAGSRQAMEKATQHYSGDALVKLRHPDYGQSMRQIGYASALANISSPKVERLAALKPPDSMRPAFERYLEGERQVYYDDNIALSAAHAVHIGEYAAALSSHRRHEQRALELADDAGLAECARSE
jgi:hypothetical protein